MKKFVVYWYDGTVKCLEGANIDNALERAGYDMTEWNCIESYRESYQNRCIKCGSDKIVDLFKGEYCPRCNDWC